MSLSLIDYTTDPKNYNTYLLLSDIDDLKTYIPFKLKEFDNADNKSALLRNASKELDNKYNFKGVMKEIQQYLKFPRGNVDWTDDIPIDIKVATLIIANQLAIDVFNIGKPKTSGDIKRERIGRTLEVEYSEDTVNSNKIDIFEASINQILDTYLIKGLYLRRG